MAAVSPAAAAGREFSARFQAVFRDVEVRPDPDTPRRWIASIGANPGTLSSFAAARGLALVHGFRRQRRRLECPPRRVRPWP